MTEQTFVTFLVSMLIGWAVGTGVGLLLITKVLIPRWARRPR